MSRPNFLIAEPEPSESISARKLVLETAKFNVITAYSGREAEELLHQFPNVSAFIIHSGIDDVPCQALALLAKKLNPEMPVILLATHMGHSCEGVDHHVSSHSPEDLLELLRELFGDPRPAENQPAAAPRQRTGTAE
jgi:DNA-binding NtrC family response regulator